jgi:hypothetical protein
MPMIIEFACSSERFDGSHRFMSIALTPRPKLRARERCGLINFFMQCRTGIVNKVGGPIGR